MTQLSHLKESFGMDTYNYMYKDVHHSIEM